MPAASSITSSITRPISAALWPAPGRSCKGCTSRPIRAICGTASSRTCSSNSVPADAIAANPIAARRICRFPVHLDDDHGTIIAAVAVDSAAGGAIAIRPDRRLGRGGTARAGGRGIDLGSSSRSRECESRSSPAASGRPGRAGRPDRDGRPRRPP